MPEPRGPNSGWNIDTLHSYVLRVIEERDRQYSERDQANKDALRAALQATKEASDKADAALREYKSGSNEWRDTLEKIVNDLLTKDEYSRNHKDLIERVGKAEKEALTKEEYRQNHKDLVDRVSRLEEEQVRIAGGREQSRINSSTTMWVIGLGVVVLAAILGTIIWKR